MSRLLVACFVSTVFGAFELLESLTNVEEPAMAMLFVFFPINGLIAIGLVATGWIAAWFSWVAAYRVIPSLSMALAALIVFAIAAPERDRQPIPEQPVC
jgi:hypothetical protein